jgi:hypothetical protein
MKFNFKKISAIATSVLMTGMTLGTAMAAGIKPADLGGQGNFAIVYGATAHSLDQTQATAIDTALRNQFSTGTSVVVGDVALTDDEVTLGGTVVSGSTKISSPVKNNKLRNLLKEKVTWDDGSGDDEYNIEEQILLSDMELVTNLDRAELEGVALTNRKGFEYRLYLDDDFNFATLASDNSLELPILGEDYEIIGVDNNKITVTTSSETAMSVGQTYTLSNGKVVTLLGVFSGSVEVLVDGTSKIISENRDAKINGVRVKVESIGYNSNAPDTSRAVLRIGEDLVKTYEHESAFIGQDEDDPTWIWSINTAKTGTGRFIGVKYAKNTYRETDSEIQYVGGGYTLPNNYAAVTFDELANVDYQKVKVYFEEVDLYGADDDAESMNDKNVLVIEAENGDSIKIGNSENDIKETNKLYVFINDSDSDEEVQVYAYDNDGEFSPSKKIRQVFNATYDADGIVLADIEIEDTLLSLNLSDFGVGGVLPANGMISLLVTHNGTSEVMKASMNATNLIGFGANEEDAEAGDVSFAKRDVSTKDYSYMDYYGIKISEGTTVESEVDSDEITLSVPEERVYAKVSVSMGATTTSTGSVGNMIFRDTESSSYAGKNVVIVGGSCVNSAAATVLGVASDRGVPGCYADTGLEAGQFLIKKGLLNGKTAIVVAGYEADDTVKAAQFLINKGAVEGKYSSTTSEIIA